MYFLMINTYIINWLFEQFSQKKKKNQLKGYSNN